MSDDGRLGALPLFLLEPLLPRQRIQLHVFELKYRRMFDSIVAGDQRFGMICSQVLSAGECGWTGCGVGGVNGEGGDL